MRFHWSWIEPVMPVPYVPTLGPVHPDDPVPDLLAAVVETAGTGRFLPYDKDRRWSDTKTERVLTDAIEHDRRQTLIPTLAERGAGTVKVHVYGAAPDGLSAGADLARKLAAVHGAAKARVVWFLGPNQPETYADGVSTRIQVKDFSTGPGKAPAAPVQKYKQLPEEVRADFAAFAEQMAADGFAFLYEQMQAGTVGPVLTVLHGDHVAGAIGPMETMTDPSGAARLLPQYFGAAAASGAWLWSGPVARGDALGAPARRRLPTPADRGRRRIRPPVRDRRTYVARVRQPDGCMTRSGSGRRRGAISRLAEMRRRPANKKAISPKKRISQERLGRIRESKRPCRTRDAPIDRPPRPWRRGLVTWRRAAGRTHPVRSVTSPIAIASRPVSMPAPTTHDMRAAPFSDRLRSGTRVTPAPEMPT